MTVPRTLVPGRAAISCSRSTKSRRNWRFPRRPSCRSAQYASGEAWQNVTIDGGVFAGKAAVEGDTALPALASRRGMTLSGQMPRSVGRASPNNPFTPGVREAYQFTQGEFFPVSLASESGRVAFVPINRGADFFDRFSHATESNILSPTTWNNYSIGALQCAMRLDITQVRARRT